MSISHVGLYLYFHWSLCHNRGIWNWGALCGWSFGCRRKLQPVLMHRNQWEKFWYHSRYGFSHLSLEFFRMYSFHRELLSPLSLLLTWVAVVRPVVEREKKEKLEWVPLHVAPQSMKKDRVTVPFSDTQRIKCSSSSDNRLICTAGRFMYVWLHILKNVTSIWVHALFQDMSGKI